MTFESRCNTDAEYMMRHVCLQGMSMTSQGSETKLVIREDRPEHSRVSEAEVLWKELLAC